MLVNILNENVVIPYLNIKGPVFGIDLAPGVAGAIAERRWVNIEKTTYPTAMLKKKQYQERIAREEAEAKLNVESDVLVEETQPEVEEKTINIGDVFDKKVEVTEEDLDIDSILEENIENILDVTKDDGGVIPKKKIRHYRMSTLEKMKKKELTQVLIDRGIATGKYAPKYYDTCEKLIAKIIATQEDEDLVP